MIMELTDKVDMPTYALSYLINGDLSGITEDDVKNIDEFVSMYNEPIFDVADEVYFSKSPAFGLPTTCVECLISENVE